MRGSDRPVNTYLPVPGGWEIRIADGAPDAGPEARRRIGAVTELPGSTGHEDNPDLERRPPRDDPRQHRRPLYPPADRGMVWAREELAQLPRLTFRPLVLAYNAPRFAFDFHHAGGLLGHLKLGLAADGGGKWLDRWSGLAVRYVDGRMEYDLRDEDLAGAQVHLSAIALAASAGLLLRYEVTGGGAGASLIWFYGGASGLHTNYNFGLPEFAFAPAQCARDEVGWQGGAFRLRRAFEQNEPICRDACAAVGRLPGWAAHVRGGAGTGRRGLAPPEAAMATPAELAARTDWVDGDAPALRRACVAVGQVCLEGGRATGYLAVGLGGDIEAVLADPETAYQRALARNARIAGRVVTRTPDPHLDAAMPMMAFATEGTWGDLAILHGGWSWRQGYLGWRTHHGPDCYGWTDRTGASIRSHVRLGRIAAGDDIGAVGAVIDTGPGVYYNMMEVFLDHVRHHFEYTGDLALMRELYPVLEGIVEWEDRRLRPGPEPLYESCLNTWISDSHWYVRGQCTQASAYMLGAHQLLADLARRLGRDPGPWERQAREIRAALQRLLWMPRPGVFAEYRDTLGHRLLHPEPELATLYHAAEFGAADDLQVWQMLHWADTHLERVDTAGDGHMLWSANWHPNKARSYTHSTRELAYAEELNLALTNCQVGRADEAYGLLRAALCGIYNGPTPGGLACHAYADGRQRANDEFADAISMFGRAVCEGLFGISPRRPDRAVRLSPQFPSGWEEASIRTSHFSYAWQDRGGQMRIEWQSPVPAAVELRLPLRAAAIEGAAVDGEPVAHRTEAGVGLTWVRVRTPEATTGRIEVRYVPAGEAVLARPAERGVIQGEELVLAASPGGTRDYLDPQGLLEKARLESGALRGTVRGAAGPGVLFLAVGPEACPRWVPVRLRVEPGHREAPKVWSPPATRGRDRDPGEWHLIDLEALYSCALTEVLDRVLAAAEPPALPASRVGFGYRNDHMKARIYTPPSDAAWRAKVGPDGVAWTADGIPFRTAREGDNLAVVTLAGGFAPRVEAPVDAAGETLYLMVSGITFPAQSHVANLRVELTYEGGVQESVDLENPAGIGDCWGTCLGRFHDTAANGFENLGGRFGPAGSCEAGDLTRPVAVDTEAHLVAVPLRPGETLASLALEAIANDAVFGLMGASIRR
ncbi:MAG: DUF4450 domain-containing protein [Gemmatimonadota bacterium]